MLQAGSRTVRQHAIRRCDLDDVIGISSLIPSVLFNFTNNYPKFVGIQCFLLLARWTILKAWLEFFRTKFSSKREFVSLDAKRFSSDARTYELLRIGNPALKSPETAVTSPAANAFDTYRRSLSGTPDYFDKEVQREYRSPTLSFSSPRAPSQVAMRVEWDPRATHARGGLGLHPPVVEDNHDGMTNKI